MDGQAYAATYFLADPKNNLSAVLMMQILDADKNIKKDFYNNIFKNLYEIKSLYHLLTYLSFGILDTIQKTAVQYHSVFVLLFVKFTFCFIFSFFIAKKNKVKKFYLSNNYKIQITRCILSVCESCFFVLSFRQLALADAHTIGSLAPVLVLVFSYFILKEKKPLLAKNLIMDLD